MASFSPFVFIVGSPRSGTTLLQNLLNHHHQIAQWYEPYYLWENFFPVPDHDIWDRNHLTKNMKNRIRNEFKRYRKKSGKPVIVDKTPTHSFNMDIIFTIFPEAKFIHILRDGRDVTCSINREWRKRSEMVQNKDLLRFLKLIFETLQRQPFWRYRLMTVFYELKSALTGNAAFNPQNFFNKARWKGEAGWGPRFINWRHFLQAHSILEVNAMQWVACVEAVSDTWPYLPRNHKIEIYYEDLIQSPEIILSAILDFIGVSATPGFFEALPRINHKNFNKWKKEWLPEEIEKIKPIVSPLLNRLGYSKRYPW